MLLGLNTTLDLNNHIIPSIQYSLSHIKTLQNIVLNSPAFVLLLL